MEIKLDRNLKKDKKIFNDLISTFLFIQSKMKK